MKKLPISGEISRELWLIFFLLNFLYFLFTYFSLSLSFSFRVGYRMSWKATVLCLRCAVTDASEARFDGKGLRWKVRKWNEFVVLCHHIIPIKHPQPSLISIPRFVFFFAILLGTAVFSAFCLTIRFKLGVGKSSRLTIQTLSISCCFSFFFLVARHFHKITMCK